MMFGRKKYERSHYSRGVMAAESEYKVGLSVMCGLRISEGKDLTAHDRFDMLETIRTCSEFDQLYYGEAYCQGMIDFADHESKLIKEGLK